MLHNSIIEWLDTIYWPINNVMDVIEVMDVNIAKNMFFGDFDPQMTGYHDL